MLITGVRFLIGVWVLCALSQAVFLLSKAGVVWAGPVEAEALELVTRYVLRETTAGVAFSNRLTGLSMRRLNDAGYASLVERLKWGTAQELNAELRSELERIYQALEANRIGKLSPPTTDAVPAPVPKLEKLSADDMRFLEDAAGALRNPTLERLLSEHVTVLEIARGEFGYISRSGTYHSTYQNSLKKLGSEGPVPARPDPDAFGPAGTTSLKKEQLRWWGRLFMRTRAAARFAKALAVTELQWRKFISDAHISEVERKKLFKELADRAVALNQTNIVLGSIPESVHAELLMLAYANEPKVALLKLGQQTGEATRTFLASSRGPKDIEVYIAARKAAGKDLPLNDVVYEAERRMLNVLERCRSLGGTVEAGGVVEVGELARAEQNFLNARNNLNAARYEMTKAKRAGDSRSYDKWMAESEFQRDKLDKAARVLESKSLDFAKNYPLVDSFVNLRYGRVKESLVQPIDMPDPFVVGRVQIEAWEATYERALSRSIKGLIWEEADLAVSTQKGATRTKIRELNQWTSQLTGRKFTDTVFGQDFKQFAQHHVVAGLQKVAALLKWTVPIGVLQQIGAKVVENLIEEEKKEKEETIKKNTPKDDDEEDEEDEEGDGTKPKPKPTVTAKPGASASASPSSSASVSPAYVPPPKPAASAKKPGGDDDDE